MNFWPDEKSRASAEVTGSGSVAKNAKPNWEKMSRDSDQRRRRPFRHRHPSEPTLSQRAIVHTTPLQFLTHFRNQHGRRRQDPVCICPHHLICCWNRGLTERPYRYPKEVWSPAGGWYSRPANWKLNTAVMGAAMLGVVAATWSLSAEREHRDKMPEPGRFFPSR